MCCTTLFGFIVGVVLFRVFRRYAAWRWGYGGGSSGHCGGHRGSGCAGHGHDHQRAYNAGSGFHGDRGFGAAQGRGFAGSASDNAAGNSAPTGRPIDDLVRSLELNQRQKDEAAPVITLIKQRLGVVGSRVDSALQVLANDRFDPEPLRAPLADLPEPLVRELLEGLEHFHTILISEQREQLRRELQRR